MEEPSPRSGRWAIAAALAAAIAVGGGGFLLGRSTAEPMPGSSSAPVAAPSAAATAEPILQGPLGRAEILALAEDAADAIAAGRQPGPDIAQADGRRFELRLPFGCAGSAGENSTASMRWRYDAQNETLRLHVAPVVWTTADWWTGDAPAGVEAVEGFWVPRPWTSSEGCPAKAAIPTPGGTAPATLPEQSLALGQVFFADTARNSRRNGNPYRAAIHVPAAQFGAPEGFRLRITGRIAGNRATGPVRCRQPAGPNQRPICLVSVVFDEVAIENPANGETLSTWSLGGRDTPQT